MRASGHCPLFLEIAPLQLDRTNTGFAAGAKVQHEFGVRALLAGCEQFEVAGANPSLDSINLNWTIV
jgi:hypothetical protein